MDTHGVVWFMQWEEDLIVWLQHLCEGTFLQPILSWLNQLFSFMGEEIICIAVMGIIYWGFDKKKGERIGAAVMFANVGIGMLKNVFSRYRPWYASEKIELLRDVDGFSFPSGHSANCTSLYPTAAYEYKEKKWLVWVAVLVPLLCGISRCYVGAHWPTDVIVGWLTGLVIFVAVEWILRKVKNKYIFYGAAIVLSFFGMFYCVTNDYYNSFGMLIGFVAGLAYEERFVHFENTKNVWIAILRTAVGGVLYFALNTVIKMIIGGLAPEGSMGYLLLRSLRYGLVTFFLIGIYPYAFRLGKKRAANAETEK